MTIERLKEKALNYRDYKTWIMSMTQEDFVEAYSIIRLTGHIRLQSFWEYAHGLIYTTPAMIRAIGEANRKQKSILDKLAVPLHKCCAGRGEQLENYCIDCTKLTERIDELILRWFKL